MGHEEHIVKLGIAYAHTSLRQALRRSLECDGDFQVVGEAGDVSATLSLINGGGCDVLLYVVSPFEGDVESRIQDIAEDETAPAVLVLALSDDPNLALRTLRAGAAGYLLTHAPLAELLSAVRQVHTGGRYLPPRLQREINERYLTHGNGSAGLHVLTAREREVVQRLARGCTNREIAEELHISIKTVDTHRGNILRKLELRNNSDLTRFALRYGLIELEEKL